MQESKDGGSTCSGYGEHMSAYPYSNIGKAPRRGKPVHRGIHARLGTKDVDGGGELRTQQRHSRPLGSPTDALSDTQGCWCVVTARQHGR